MYLLHKEDMEDRKQLTAYVNKLEVVINGVMEDDRLRCHLETEGVVDNYKSIIAKFKQSLDQKECPIVVAGMKA